jgi:enterochelin esterase-like enzyme
MRMNRLVPAVLCTMIVSSFSTLAQHQEPLLSPEVQADNHVVFRFRAPHALKVEVAIEGQATPTAMRMDEHGIWTGATGPLAPDFYGYSFSADGTRLIDPSNPLLKPNLLDTESLLHVAGPPSLPWEWNPVPHGEIHHHFYHSKVAGDDRDFYVYTPPDYDAGAKPDYPVLYLLHGFSDDASGWTAVGRAHVILDNLIAQGKAEPMVIVMPLGYGDMEVIRRGWGSWADKELAERNLSRFTDALVEEVIPRVEAAYRIKKDRQSRAIAGLSMGGAESLLTGLNHLDQFAWIGAFSSGGIDLTSFSAEFPEVDESVNPKLKLLWIACGTDDGLIKVNREFKSWLKTKGVEFRDIETPGMHTWMVWRRNLAAFLPLLFR